MYTVTKVDQISKEKPSSWQLKTSEQIDITVSYRYGFIFIEVGDEHLFKAKITDDLTDSKIEWGQLLSYMIEMLPEEMIDFSPVMTKQE